MWHGSIFESCFVSTTEPHEIAQTFLAFKSQAENVRGGNWDTACEKLESMGFTNLVSQVSTLKDCAIFSDPEKEQVLKMDLRTGSISSLEFSNLGLLGLPVNLQFSSRWVCKAKDIIWINWFPSLDFQKVYLFLQTKFHFSKLAVCQGTKNCCTEVHIDSSGI
jgi:hypothetical protein